MRNKFIYLKLLLLILASSCTPKLDKNPLIIPPNFAQMPDLTKPQQKIGKKERDEQIVRLKELLIESEQ